MKALRYELMRINFKLIIRNLVRSKRNTILNIVGLSIGFACSFTIISWIKNEFSYDKYLPDVDRIYRLTFETNTNGKTIHFARCWEKWISQIPTNFPQIEELVRLSPYRHTAIKFAENRFYSDRVFATDSNFFKVFGIELLSGDSAKLLNEPYSAVISSSLAKKYFGDIYPIGQTIYMSGEYDTKMSPFTVKGIMKDTPSNTHIHFDIITSFVNPQESPDWAYVYLLLKEKVSPVTLVAELPSFIRNVEKENGQTVFTPFLQRITDIHLHSNKGREVEPNGNMAGILLFTFIMMVLLLISWVNYYNLNKAGILSLQKQIKIQLIMGSENRLIIVQTAVESLLCVIAALILASVILDSSGRLLDFITENSSFSIGLNDLVSNCSSVAAISAISVLVGSLPVILHITKGQRLTGFKDVPQISFNRVSSYGILMIVQFCLSIILMVAAITIYQQKEFIFSGSMGRMSSNILVFKNQNWEVRSKYQAFRNSALESPFIKSVTASMETPSGETLDVMQVESSAFDESQKDKSLYVLSVEDNFLDFFNIPLLAGRNFARFNPDRKGEDYILNETAVKELGWNPQEAIGRPLKIKFNSPGIFYGGTVVGVVKDFNFNTFKQEIKPYVLFQKPIFYLCFLVKTDSIHKEEAIRHLKTLWEEKLPDYPFQYEFISDVYKTAYQKELMQAKLTAFFSILAILIICIGLFSITSVLVAHRTKEIGVRKVNGANVLNLLLMMNSDFIRWFVIAYIIACPIGLYAMHIWLQNFVYRTEIKWWVFVFAGFIIFSITVLTVSWISWRAARRNPVESLRYE
jgi:putative ABC transport system permease protein